MSERDRPAADDLRFTGSETSPPRPRCRYCDQPIEGGEENGLVGSAAAHYYCEKAEAAYAETPKGDEP